MSLNLNIVGAVPQEYDPDILYRITDSQHRLARKVIASATTFKEKEDVNHFGLIDSINSHWQTAISDSFHTAYLAVSEFIQQNEIIDDALVKVIVLGAAAHHGHTRKSTGETTFIAHQHRGVAMPAYNFFHAFYNELGIAPGLAAALAYAHDIREDWAKHFVANNFPALNAVHALTPDLKLNNITTEFEVADAFVKHLLETGFRDNHYMRQLADTNDSRLDSLELLTVSPKIKALISTTQDIDVTGEWLSNKIPYMHILETVIKIFDMADNTDPLKQRPGKSAQRCILFNRLATKLQIQLQNAPNALASINTFIFSTINRFSDELDCSHHIDNMYARVRELTLNQWLDSIEQAELAHLSHGCTDIASLRSKLRNFLRLRSNLVA